MINSCWCGELTKVSGVCGVVVGTEQYGHILPSFHLQRGLLPKARMLTAHFPGMPVILFSVTFKVAENNPIPFVSRTGPLQPLL